MKAKDLQSIPMEKESFPRTLGLIEQSSHGNALGSALVAGFWSSKNERQIFVTAHGETSTKEPSKKVTSETIFDLASLTKIMATVPLAAELVERGLLEWEQPVLNFFSEKKFESIELHHLLSHTAGLPAWKPFYQKLQDHFAPVPLHRVPILERQDEVKRLVLNEAPEAPPGTKCEYSDLGFFMLGFLLEDLTSSALDHAVDEHVFQKMGFETAHYVRVDRAPVDAIEAGTAATEQCPWRGAVLQGQVHDDNCWAMGGYAGNAGVFSDIRDVLHYGRLLLSGYFKDETMKRFRTRMTEPVGCTRTLGFDTPDPKDSSVGRHFSDQTIGHLGFTGTSLWVDFEAELAVALLTNRVHPSRDNEAIKTFRPTFHNAIREDIGSLKS